MTSAHELCKRSVLGLLALAAAGLALGLAVPRISSRSTAAAAPTAPAVMAQPVIGLPVTHPTLIGSSPAESPGEVWGYSTGGPGFQIVRYSTEAGWQIQPAPLDGEGNALHGFAPAPGPLAGHTTPDGGVAIVGEDSAKAGQLLTRDPGGSFREAPTLEAEAGGEPSGPNALLRPGETLFAANGDRVLMTAVDQPGAGTGVFLVPSESSQSQAQEGVLYLSSGKWTREPVCASPAAIESCTKPPSGFRVLGIDATSTTNAWLLASSSASGEGIELFAREAGGGGERWTQRPLGGSLGAQFAQGNLSFGSVGVKVTALTHGQPLTVTSKGLWIDGKLTASGQQGGFTIFYEPEPSNHSGQVSASWCQVPAAAAALCTYNLEAQPPAGDYRSFAWNEGGPFGQRVITGFDNGVSLSLRGTAFDRVLGAGGEAGTSAGAAFPSPQQGWLGNPLEGPLTEITAEPAPDRLQSWPVPFRRPLTSIAEQPGATPGDLAAQAIAVGHDGEVVHYFPGEGWTTEALTIGESPKVELRGIAWPELGRAYAVGTHGAMWLWQQATGLWEPDPARPPNLFLDNFTGIAFDPAQPARGYAIGQQGALLAYGKSWAQEPTCSPQTPEPCLPPGLEKADFTSIAFAGNEVLVTYQIPHFDSSEGYGFGFSGGLLVGDGSSWSVDTGVTAALGKLEVPVRVAGLPDGGAALVSERGAVIERQGPNSAWQPAAAGSVNAFPSAVAAFREGGQLRAVVSVAAEQAPSGSDYAIDRALEQQTQEGQAPVATEPFPLPNSGFLLRETAIGWQDEEHKDYPIPDRNATLPAGETGLDWPNQPDAVLALALDPNGGQGWAVGGQTGEINNEGLGETLQHVEAIQTAGVMRYPASGAAPTGFSSAPEPTNPINPTFAIGGGAQCATACADLATDQLGPDEWLLNSIQQAARTPGVSAFLYTGPHLAVGLGQDKGFGASAFLREQERYAQLLASPNGTLGVYAAPSESDLGEEGGLSLFGAALGAHAPAGAVPARTPAPPAGKGAYALRPGAGQVWVIVLDYSQPSLGEAQQCWLAQQLAWANRREAPAIVIGNRGMTGGGNEAADASQVIPILVTGKPPSEECKQSIKKEGLLEAGASAYFYDYPQQSRVYPISAGGLSIETYGSGTLGYIVPPGQTQTEFLGASGVLLTEVETSKRLRANVAPILVRMMPDISELALNATNGTLLRRSQPALFNALARRPQAGMLCLKGGAKCEFLPDPYVPIPTVCQGPNCAAGIFPEYRFTSSNPDIGDFVKPDPASPDGTTVLQGANGKPIPDEHSGLFCAYNPGKTMVSVQTGGLSYSEQITVLGGSVEQPCGTTPLRNPPAPTREAGLPAPLPPPTVNPTIAPNGTLPPPPPPPPLPLAPRPSHMRPQHITPPTPVPAAQLFPLVALVPPPAPSAARPTPPSGTAQVPAQSPVSQQVTVAEREEEQQSATEFVHHMVAYRHPEEAPLPTWPLGLLPIALAAGLGMRRRQSPPAPAYVERGPSARHKR